MIISEHLNNFEQGLMSNKKTEDTFDTSNPVYRDLVERVGKVDTKLCKTNLEKTSLYENALKEALQNEYPDKHWSEVTGCDIRTTLLESGNDIDKTARKIVESFKVQEKKPAVKKTTGILAENMKKKSLKEAKSLKEDTPRDLLQGIVNNPAYSRGYRGYGKYQNKLSSGTNIDFNASNATEVTPEEIMRMKKSGEPLDKIFIVVDGGTRIKMDSPNVIQLDREGHPYEHGAVRSYAKRKNQSLKSVIDEYQGYEDRGYNVKYYKYDYKNSRETHPERFETPDGYGEDRKRVSNLALGANAEKYSKDMRANARYYDSNKKLREPIMKFNELKSKLRKAKNVVDTYTANLKSAKAVGGANRDFQYAEYLKNQIAQLQAQLDQVQSRLSADQGQKEIADLRKTVNDCRSEYNDIQVELDRLLRRGISVDKLLPPTTESLKEEAEWKYTLSCSDDLESAIDGGDLEEVIEALKGAYDELVDQELFDEGRRDKVFSALEQIDVYDDGAEAKVEKKLDQFYNVCDKLGVKISFNESLKEDWYHFSYLSGGNPYIAKNEKERDRILKKYKGKVEEIKPGFYEIDDVYDYSGKSIKEDTVKQGKSWVNKGKEGTHGKFKTKKGADAQRKAMFANGYKEGLKESYEDFTNVDVLAKAIDDAYDDLASDPQGGGCYTLELDNRLAVCVGWEDGFDPEDTPFGDGWDIVTGIKVWTSDDMRTDYEWINSPFYRGGDVWDTTTSIGKGDGKSVAPWLLKEYEEMKNLPMTEQGEIIEVPEQVVYSKSELDDLVSRNSVGNYDFDLQWEIGNKLEDDYGLEPEDFDYEIKGNDVIVGNISWKLNESKSSRRKGKKLTEAPIYDLTPQYDSRKSFYSKAKVDTGDKGDKNKLYSYNTLVAEIKDGKPVVYGTYSSTTLRHIKDWLRQNGFKAESAKQIMADYGTKDEALTERNLTKAERYNKMLHKTFDDYRARLERMKDFLRKNTEASEEEIEDAYQHTGMSSSDKDLWGLLKKYGVHDAFFKNESFKAKQEESLTESSDGSSVENEFKNYKSFSSNFKPLTIVKRGKEYFVYKKGDEPKDGEDNYIQHGSKEYIDGWLYGAVQAKMKKLESFKAKKGKKSLNEGTSNFFSMDGLPLLVFYTMDEVLDMEEHYIDSELSDSEYDGMDEDQLARIADDLSEKFWDELDVCVLEEEELSELEKDIDEHNYDMLDKYNYKAEDGEAFDPEKVELKAGYYSAAQMYCNDKYCDEQEFNDHLTFFEEMKKKYGLTELEVAYRFSNGETGYSKK